jgi:hypothetical protein
MYAFEMPQSKNTREFLQVPCDMYSPLPNLWGMFPTSAVIHDLDSYLFHKSMEKYGFFTSQVPTCLFELVELSKLPNRCSCLKQADAPTNPPHI